MSQPNTTADFLYLYGLCPAAEFKESKVPTIMGIDEKMVSIKIFKDIAVVISSVNSDDFSQEQIDHNLKDSKWLEEKALQHHTCIEKVYRSFTVLPMSFCTIFHNEESLEKLLHAQYDAILQKLTSLRHKQEWNLKVYCSIERAKAYVENNHSSVSELREKLKTMPKGKQFLMKKRLEQLVAEK